MKALRANDEGSSSSSSYMKDSCNNTMGTVKLRSSPECFYYAMKRECECAISGIAIILDHG